MSAWSACSFLFVQRVLFYLRLTEDWEKNFLANEIKNYLQWNDVPKEKCKILTFFLDKLHNDYFKRGIKDKDEQRKKAQEEYYKKHILQNNLF